MEYLQPAASTQTIPATNHAFDLSHTKHEARGSYSPICAAALLTNTGSDPEFWRIPVTTSSVPGHNQRGAPHSRRQRSRAGMHGLRGQSRTTHERGRSANMPSDWLTSIAQANSEAVIV